MWVEVCVSSCACVCWCACLFVTHTVHQDPTVPLVCGISRFKIGPSVGGGQEQTAERGGEKKKSEEGKENGTHDVHVHRNSGKFFIFI